MDNIVKKRTMGWQIRVRLLLDGERSLARSVS